MYKHLILFIIGGVLCSALYAQNASEHYADFGFVAGSDPWLTSNNASGLYKLSLDNISYGEISFKKDNGKFINYFQSDNSYTFGGKAESFYRLSPKVVVYGKISYNNFKGKNMGGASFVDPYYNPFNIVAEDDDTAGEKQLERYNLAGAISVDVYKGLKLGAKIDYLAANYAKFKDLRHKNKLTDLSLTIGASYPVNRLLEVGLNYFYRRTVEGIEFKTYGNKDMQYYSLIDFGAFFGRREIFGDTGYSKDGDDKPMFNKFHGISGQMELSFSGRARLYNEFTYKSRDGLYGKRALRSIVYSEHGSSTYEYRGVFSLNDNKNLHTVELYAGKEALDNNENIYNADDSNNDVIYYGSTRVLDQDRITAKLSYTANLGIVDYYPTWVLKAGVGYFQQKKTASLYPYYRKQTIRITGVDVSADRNIFSTGGQIYKFQLGTAFSTGSGTDKNDGVYTNEPGGSTPTTLDTYLYREYEYLTSPQAHIAAGFGYQRPVNSEVAIYGNIDCRVSKGFGIEYLKGSTFTSVGIRIGCYF